jgi:hypothetical protein
MNGGWRFPSRKQVWCGRSSFVGLMLLCQLLVFTMGPAVDQRVILVSIQPPPPELEKEEEDIPVSDPLSHIPPPPTTLSSELDDTSSLIHHLKTTTTTTTSLATTTNDNMIKFPDKPLHNVHSILRQSIGTTILQNPHENPLRQCAPTVQFQLRQRRRQQQQRRDDDDDTTTIEYTLHAMMTETPANNNNNTNKRPNVIPKLMGGDELFVEWVSLVDPSDMGVALISTNDETNHGTYTLKFVRPPIHQQNVTRSRRSNRNHYGTATGPSPMGRLTIYYDYTCGIGSFFAPKKKHYRRAGEVHVTLANDKVPRPFIHDFVPPNTDFQIDLSKYDKVIAFGDSLMLQFVRQFQAGGFWSRTIHYEENINQCISNSQEAETAIQKFMEWHGSEIQEAHEKRVAVILGSAVWDAMRGCVRRDFVDHRAAIRQLITTLRTWYPQVDYYWKSPSAIVLHRHAPLEEMLVDPVWLERSKYISDGVPRHIYSVQKELMTELNVTFLDVFDAYYLSSPWTLPGDSRHFQDDISFLMLSYFWPGLNRTNLTYKQKVKTSA